MVDRSIMPAVQPLKEIRFPILIQKQLNNKVPVFFIQQGNVPILQISVVFYAGNTASTAKHIPIAANALIAEGTAHKTSQEIFDALDFYGAYLQTYCANEIADVSLYTSVKHLEKVLPILYEVVTEPAYPESEIQLWKQRHIEQLKVNKQKTSYLAGNTFKQALYPQHPYGYVMDEQDYNTVHQPELIQFHKNAYIPENSFILVSGDEYDIDKVLKWLNQYWGYTSGKYFQKPAITLPQAQQGVIHVPKSDAMQASLRIGARMIHHAHPDYLSLKVLITLYGGYFGSRLMSNLREERGYTYGIYASLIGLKQDSYLSISADVGISVANDAIEQIKIEAEKLCNEPISQDELEIVKNYMLGQLTGDFETAFNTADYYKSLITLGYDTQHLYQFVDTIKQITVQDLHNLAQLYLDPTQWLYVKAGG
ncbi:MAG: insulinase family protein [Bacteroidia bacterium]|nr:insulinase family protein [Bacteroidia bacterium]MDW8347750.1 pitrilysin family protein [Bacteroidia bacterium]